MKDNIHVVVLIDGKRHLAHRAVLKAAGIQIPDNCEICDLGPNRPENDLVKLTICPIIEEQPQDTRNHLTAKFVANRTKIRRPRRVLTDEQYERAWRLKLQGWSIIRIAAVFGLNPNTMRSLLCSRTYKKPERIQGVPLTQEARDQTSQSEWADALAKAVSLAGGRDVLRRLIDQKEAESEQIERHTGTREKASPYSVRSEQVLRGYKPSMRLVREAISSLSSGTLFTRKTIVDWVKANHPDALARVTNGASLSQRIASLAGGDVPLIALHAIQRGGTLKVWRKL